MKFDVSTKEAVLASFDVLRTDFAEMQKVEQLEALDTFLEASKAFDIELDFAGLLKDGGNGMSKLGDMGTEDFTKLVKESLAEHKTVGQEIDGLKTAIAEKDSTIEALTQAKAEVEEKLEAAANTIKDQEGKIAELTKANEVFVKEKEEREIEERFTKRLEVLAKAGVDLDNLGDKEKETIKGLSDEAFEPWANVVASIKPKEVPVEKEEEKEPKTTLAEASEKLEGIENKEETTVDEGFTGVIRQLSIHSGIIRK